MDHDARRIIEMQLGGLAVQNAELLAETARLRDRVALLLQQARADADTIQILRDALEAKGSAPPPTATPFLDAFFSHPVPAAVLTDEPAPAGATLH